MKRFWNHPWVCAAYNILLVMAAYTLSRLFFFVTSPDLFPDVSAAHLWEMLLGGVRFDLTAILYLSSVYLLLALFPLPMNWRQNGVYQSVAKWFFLVPNLVGIAVNCADTVYVRFTDRRTTITFFDEFQNDGNLLSVFLQGAVQYWYVTIFTIFLMAGVVWLYRKSTHDPSPVTPTSIISLRPCFLWYRSISLSSVSVGDSVSTHARSRSVMHSNIPTDRRRPCLCSIRRSASCVLPKVAPIPSRIISRRTRWLVS